MNMLFSKWGWFTAVAMVMGGTALTGCSSSDSNNGGASGSANAGAAGDDGTAGSGEAGDTGKTGVGGKSNTGKGGAAGADVTEGGSAGEGTAGESTVSRGGSGSGGRPTPTGGAPNRGGATGVGGRTTPTEGGSAGEGATGEAGAGQAGDSGVAGSTSTGGDTAELVRALCDWEYRCCDTGELRYQLGTFTTSSADCQERFNYELTKNSTDNEFSAATSGAVSLLGKLGFVVDLNRVDLNPEGITACVDSWDLLACNTPWDSTLGPVRCTAGAVGEDPCAFDNLFIPKLASGEQCTLDLTEGSFGGNDVECVAGTTCVAANTADNPNNYPICVDRGVEGDFCGDDDAQCDWNFYCDVSGRCAPKGDVGADCTYLDPEVPVQGELDASCLPGLSCNPNTLLCTSPCDVDALCYDDFGSCPEGMSCVPMTVGDDMDTFKSCQYQGMTNSDRCDTDNDCYINRYCNDAGRCAEDKVDTDPCTKDAECPDGSFCSTVDATCKPILDRGVLCNRQADGTTNECDSGAVCVYHPDAAIPQNECTVSKNALRVECLADFDCASGLCEFANTAAVAMTCVAGAQADAACDDNLADGEQLRCAPGFSCIDTMCVDLAEAGGACEDLGAPNSALCGNGMCTEIWNETMCTDSATPVERAGTGAMCDGA